MGGGQAYSLRSGSSAALVAVAVAAMLAVALLYTGPSLPLILSMPLLAFLFVLPMLGVGGWPVTYLSMALSIFYTSLALPAAILFPVYAVLLLRYVAGLVVSAEASGGVLGPSSSAVLRPLPFFLIATLANYRVIFSVAILASSILAISLIRYVALTRFRLIRVDHDREVILGRNLAVRVSVDPGGEAYALLALGPATKAQKVSAATTLSLELTPRSLGRHSLLLRITALDPWLVAGRPVTELPISFTVIPSYLPLARRFAGELPTLPSALAEPVRTEIFVIGTGKGERAGAGEGTGKFWRFLRLLPHPLRSIARSFLHSLLASGGAAGVGEVGAGRRFFGEYYGVRDYVAGDPLKAIHWKKSISARRLVTKVYVSGESAPSGSFGTSAHASIIIADLTPSNTEELDKLVTTLLNLLQRAEKAGKEARTLLIIVLGDIAIALEGSAADVATMTIKAFAKLAPPTIHEYTSISTPINEETVEEIIEAAQKYAFMRAVSAAALTYTNTVAKELIRYGLPPPKTVAIIYGKPTTLRNTALARRLKTAGYSVVNLAQTPINKTTQAKAIGARWA